MTPYAEELLDCAIELDGCPGIRIVEWRPLPGREATSGPTPEAVAVLTSTCRAALESFDAFVASDVPFPIPFLPDWQIDVSLLPTGKEVPHHLRARAVPRPPRCWCEHLSDVRQVGRLPPAALVTPSGGASPARRERTAMSFSLHADRRLVRAGHPSVGFVVVRLQAPARTGDRPRPDASIAFCIDRSSSMRGPKIAHARAAVIEALGRLGPRDRFSIVAFDQTVEMIASDVPVTETSRAEAIRRVGALQVGLGTNLATGWHRAGWCILQSLKPHEVGRCLLLTDGQASCGVTDPHQLVFHAGALRARGVSTSAFGIGNGFDEALLGRIADTGGGSFRFIDTAERIGPFVQDELGDALDVVGRDVTVEVETPEGVVAGVLGPYRQTRQDGRLRISLPDLVAGQSLELALQVELPARAEGDTVEVAVRVDSREGALGDAAERVSFRCVNELASAGQKGDREVVRLVAQRLAAAARERAAVMNRAGNLEGAADELLDAARRVGAYGGDDLAIGQLVAELVGDAQAVRRRLGESERKSMFAAASSMVRSRRPDGGSWRP